MKNYYCSKCGKEIGPSDTYEYRGAYSCVECFDDIQETRNFERQEVMEEQRAKTDGFKGLDLGDSVIGKANREILKPQIEIAKKEGGRLRRYENR